MNEQATSLTECLSANGVMLSSVAAGRVLLVAGITSVAWRDSSEPGRPRKSYRVATPFGESLGAINEPGTVQTGDPTNLRFDRARFASLWASSQVQTALADLLAAGDVKLRDSGAAKSEAY